MYTEDYNFFLLAKGRIFGLSEGLECLSGTVGRVDKNRTKLDAPKYQNIAWLRDDLYDF